MRFKNNGLEILQWFYQSCAMAALPKQANLDFALTAERLELRIVTICLVYAMPLSS